MVLTEIRDSFCTYRDSSDFITFEESLKPLLPKINELVKDADNWQIVFDVLHYDWCKTKLAIHPDIFDELALKYSPYKDQKKEIDRFNKSAEEWLNVLDELGIQPLEGLRNSKETLSIITNREKNKSILMNHFSSIGIPHALVDLYSRFYSAPKIYNLEHLDTIRPLVVAKEVIQKSSSTGEELTQEICGALNAKMRQIKTGNAEGHCVLNNSAEERLAILDFSEFIVLNLLNDKFQGDKSKFSSKDIELIENTCDFIYRLKQNN